MEGNTMKTWANAVVEEINFAETQHGGAPSLNFDKEWFDEQGALHTTFQS